MSQNNISLLSLKRLLNSVSKVPKVVQMLWPQFGWLKSPCWSHKDLQISIPDATGDIPMIGLDCQCLNHHSKGSFAFLTVLSISRVFLIV